jgi:LPXTG-site transpeptidase (sortase) family protein
MRTVEGLRGTRSGGLHVLEHALWLVGSLALAWCLLVIGASRLDQIVAGRRLDQARLLRPAPAQVPAAERSRLPVPIERIAPLPLGTVVARLRIEKIGLSAVAKEGDDDATLRLAVGHIPGTALPPERGNAAFAGHRDRFSRRLGKLRRNDPIRLTTESGDFLYRVEWTSVVEPGETWVLAPTPRATLTLVTCYPFHFVGAAPKRFVVRARRES